jgi:hypothetical protein
LNIPNGLEDIVKWISEQVEKEVKQRCPTCSAPAQTETPTEQNQTPTTGEGE